MSFQLTGNNLSLRIINKKDDELLYSIYCSTRASEMELMKDWSDLQKENFLRMQFTAQHSYYLNHYTTAFFGIILKNNKPIGRLYLDEKYEDNSMRIIDITLLPEWRNKGIGKKILLQILAYAASKKQPVSLHVETSNRAMELYIRLGFKVISTNNLRYLMHWNV